MLLLALASESNAQIDFDSVVYQEDFDDDLGYATKGFPNATIEETENGFRLQGNNTFYRLTPNPPEPVSDDSGFEGQLYRLTTSRLFDVGPLPVQVDLSLREDSEWMLSNGQDANPQFEISSKAYVSFVLFDEVTLVEPLLLNGVTPSESLLSGSGVYATDHLLEAEDIILAPNSNEGRYMLVYELAVFVHHDTIPDDPAATLEVLARESSGHDGVEVTLNSVIVPEPSAFVLAGMAACSLACFARIRRRRNLK